MRPSHDDVSAIQLASVAGSATDHPPRRKPRRDGRKQLLVYVLPDVIKNVKRAALDDESTASAITEAALQDWLERRPKVPEGGRS